MDTQQLYELIEARRKELGLSQAELGKLALGQENSSVIQSMRRGSSPSIEKAASILAALNICLHIGGGGQGTMRQVMVAEVQPATIPNKSLDDFAVVERFDVKLSAGPGSGGDNALPMAPVAFRKQWLASIGLKTETCVVVSVTGNSMEPNLFEGDLALLDRRQGAVKNGEIYGINDIEGDTRVKRLEQINGGLLLRSDNPDCPSEVRMGEEANRVKIIGRLVWSGHTYEGASVARIRPKRSKFKHIWI